MQQGIDFSRSGDLEQRLEMTLVAVDSARAQQADEMQVASTPANTIQRGQQRRIASQFTIFDGLVDAADVLIDNPACAQVEVAYFGVAHLTRHETDRFA